MKKFILILLALALIVSAVPAFAGNSAVLVTKQVTLKMTDVETGKTTYTIYGYFKPSTSYNNGVGYSIPPYLLGVDTIIRMFITPKSGVAFSWDSVNSKVLAYFQSLGSTGGTGKLVEVTEAYNLTSLDQVAFMAIGQ